jgi:hypothetical protein
MCVHTLRGQTHPVPSSRPGAPMGQKQEKGAPPHMHKLSDSSVAEFFTSAIVQGHQIHS